MKVEDTFIVKGRGIAVVVLLTEEVPTPGDILRRPKDNASWLVRSVESFLTLTKPMVGDHISFLISDGVLIQRGDEVTFERRIADRQIPK